MAKATPFLMFQGQCEEAVNLYLSVFKDSKMISFSRYEEGGPGKAGEVAAAVISIGGQEFLCNDSTIRHTFTFTPAISVFVDCDSESELEDAYENLLAGGQALMPIGNYGFSQRFGWVQDPYGVSWQLNLK